MRDHYFGGKDESQAQRDQSPGGKDESQQQRDRRYGGKDAPRTLESAAITADAIATPVDALMIGHSTCSQKTGRLDKAHSSSMRCLTSLFGPGVGTIATAAHIERDAP